MELTQDQQAILEIAKRNGEISLAGVTQAVKTTRERTLAREVQQEASTALRSLIEKGYLHASTTTRELYVPTVRGRAASTTSGRASQAV